MKKIVLTVTLVAAMTGCVFANPIDLQVPEPNPEVEGEAELFAAIDAETARIQAFCEQFKIGWFVGR